MSRARTVRDMRLTLADTDALSRMYQRLDSGEAQRLREAAQHSRRQAAGVVGVSREAVQKWELRDRRPQGRAALQYARYLDHLALMLAVPS